MSTIRTPELAQAAAALSRLIQAADQGAANVDQGRLLVSATNGQCRVIKTDLDRRLSDGKLRELEAKDITGHDGAVPALTDQPNVPSTGGAAALLRAAAEMLERDERSGGGESAGSASALADHGNHQKAAA
jgi:hypothetical protein